jgi:serine/threonine protein kinase
MTELPDTEEFPTASAADSKKSARYKGPPPEFEGYQILGELPQGGQAVVYKAIHKATKAKVALKVLLPGLHASDKARRLFEQEVELAACLNHPNIVSIRDSAIARGQYYFSMEYVHGQPLDQYLKLKDCSLRDKIILFSKICDAMTHAHQRGVIHRDLKPPNILVDDRGEPHVLDFGLAKAAGHFTATSGSTVMPSITGQIKGTVAYMSPEQAAGRSDLIDVRTDVYSLGVVLYQMLTGRFPYDISGTTLEALQNIQSAEPVRPRQIISRFSSDVEAILLKALEKDPRQRYQSAAELLHDVQCWLEGLPIVARSVSSIYLLRKVITRHRYTSAVVGLLLTIVFGFSCVYAQLYNRVRSTNAKLSNTVASLRQETNKYLTLAQQVTFTHLLDVWHEGHQSNAQSIAKYFSRGTREEKATAFLLDPVPLEEKVAEFREQMKGIEPYFVEFIIAEQHLKDNNRTEATRAYRKSFLDAPDSGKDQLIKMRIRMRVYELAEKNQQTGSVPGAK